MGPFNGRSVVVVGRKALKLRSPCLFSHGAHVVVVHESFSPWSNFLTFGFAGPRLAEADLWGNCGGSCVLPRPHGVAR